MRTKKILTGVFITALVVGIALIAMRSYYVGIAIIAGMLLIGYREIWSLITTRRLPPLDERIRENTNKSVRNGFVFLMLVLGYLMMPFSARLVEGDNTSIVLGGLLMSGGLVYCLSYIFYDRVEPKFSVRRFKILKSFLFAIALSIALYILGGLFHNVVFSIFEIEEPVFFTIAMLGILGCLVMFVYGLFMKPAG